MTRTFTRYAVSAVLVAAAAIALWGIRNAIYAQQGEAATELPVSGDADKARQLGLAMLNYAEAHGRFPPAAILSPNGKPLLSWRVLILPYLGDDAKKLYSQFHLDEPWDSPANKPLSEKIPSVFSPHDADADPFSSPDTLWQVFDGGTTIFANAQGMPFSDIHDGLSNTILLVESNTAVPWTKPADLSFDALSPTTHQGLDVQRGFRVVMADGSVRKVPPSFPIDKLKEFITRKGNEHALDTSVLTQFDVWAPERAEEGPNTRREPSADELSQSSRRGGRGQEKVSGGTDFAWPKWEPQYQETRQVAIRVYPLKNQKASELAKAINKMYPHLRLGTQNQGNGVILVGGTPAMEARLQAFIEYSELSPDEKAKRGLPDSIRQFLQGEAQEMLVGANPRPSTRRVPLRGAAGPELEQQVRQEFDARQTSLRQQIKDFSERLQRLTVLVDERDRAKEAIIQRRVDELRNPNLRWEAADQAASGSNRSQQPLAAVGNTDRPADEAKPKVAAETFPLRHIKPDRVVKVLIEDFHGSAGIQLSQTSDSIKVAGVPADLERIRALVKNLDVPPPAGDEASATVAELDGLWEAILPPDLADTVPVEKRLRLVFYKNMHATFIGKTLQTACTFSITPSASPKRIALHGDQPKRGLYEVSGDGLRLSIAPADAAFPTRFGTEKAEFKRINNAVPQEMLDAITSHLQDTQWSKRAGNRLSEPEGDPLGGNNKMRRQQEAQKEIEKALLQKINANFENCPLNEVLDYIAGVVEVNIYIDEVALRAEGVTSDRPITIDLKQPIALRSLLNQILSPLRLTYVVESDVLKITNEKGAGLPFSADRDATSNKTDPSGVLLLRSANDFQADLAWARSNANKAGKARDAWIAEAKKTSPNATERDVDPTLLDQWQTAKERLDFLRNEFAYQMKLFDSALETCRQEIATEQERLSEMERVSAPGNRVLDQRQAVQKTELRLKQILTLRDLYEKVNEFPSTTVVPNDVKLPGAVEMENDLRQQIGLDLSTGTVRAGQGAEERKVLVVAAVRADSPAAKAGLQEMDLIVAAHIWQIASPENLWYALSQVGSTRTDKSLEEIKVWVRRNGQDVSVRLPPIEHKW